MGTTSVSTRRAVSVIVPTLGLRERADLLHAALASITSQTGVDALPIVVFNGTRVCSDVERSVRSDPRIHVIVREEPSLPAALAAGRDEVSTPYFTTLDDDDLLLPGALSLRLDALEADPELDLVVTNGLRRRGSVEEPNISRGDDIDDAPLYALLRRNWLLPGSWLCRSDRVGSDVFRGMPRYLECTFLAVRFATRYHLRWLDEPTVVYRLGSPEAATNSRDYVVGQAGAIREILDPAMPVPVRQEFERRVSAAHHAASEFDREAGLLRAAWRWHIASLLGRGGLRYLPYTRHLVAATFRDAA